MNNNYLIHYGVPGMKWGVRRKEDIKAARQNYKEAKKDYSTASTKYVGSVLSFKPKEKKRELRRQWATANAEMVEAKATLAGAKRNSVKSADKAYAKVYRKEMNKIGSVGSRRDKRAGDASTKLYDKLTQEKGKEFADKIAKQVKAKQIVNQSLIAAEITITGASIVGSIIKNASNKPRYKKYKESVNVDFEDLQIFGKDGSKIK